MRCTVSDISEALQLALFRHTIDCRALDTAGWLLALLLTSSFVRREIRVCEHQAP
jgi:hypothetical protein